MLPDRGRNGRKSRIFGGRSPRSARVIGVRTSWTTVGDGEFFCPGCGGDRNYQRRTGKRRFVLLGLPVLPRGAAGPVVECAACQDQFGTDVLDHPTTTRLSAMLRDAVHTVVLSVLAAGGTGARATLDLAIGALCEAGFDDCSEEQLISLVTGLEADTGRVAPAEDGGVGLAIELHEALGPLAPHLAPAGREAVLLTGARVALADGPYTPAEREVLGTAGVALTLSVDDVSQLLAAARTTPS
ncbi:TerB family tellurite resistance protein [Actinomycetota bacterium Odt1-20B]